MPEFNFKPQGIAPGWLVCCVCGRAGERCESIDPDGIRYEGKAQNTFAAFVSNESEGKEVVNLFEYHKIPAYLDVKPSYPDQTKVKLGACDQHAHLLEYLWGLAIDAGDTISSELIRKAFNIRRTR